MLIFLKNLASKEIVAYKARLGALSKFPEKNKTEIKEKKTRNVFVNDKYELGKIAFLKNDQLTSHHPMNSIVFYKYVSQRDFDCNVHLEFLSFLGLSFLLFFALLELRSSAQLT